ncbi:MAG: TRAP transporter small permease subunit [Gemmobacter sp.]|nr:TRAP transporter small permease subunit [Gemmobacter sp.]
MPRFATRVLDVLCLPAQWVSWLTLPLILSILIGVIAAKIGLNVLASWQTPIPVLGRAITVNSLQDLQWYIFALLVLFGGVMALRDERHVAVDTLVSTLSPRSRLMLRTLGDLLFLVPFCAIITWYGAKFAMVSFTTGEGSTQSGLMTRWVIKAMLPLAFGFLTLAGLTRGFGTALALIRGQRG